MPISSYPRRGHPFAPQVLRVLLKVRIPAALRAASLQGKSDLCDLGADAWQGLNDFDGECLGEAVVSEMRNSSTLLLEKFSANWLPMPPIGLKLDDLELELRTYNCLKYNWPECERDLQHLGYKTIGEVMKLRGFGIKSIVDLLTSLESLEAVASSSDKATDALSKYKEAFSSATRSHHTQHGNNPHNSILLLALLDAVAKNETLGNFVELNDHLALTFRAYWNAYGLPNTWQQDISDPARHLMQAGFWQLVKNAQTVSPEQLADVQSFKELQTVADGGCFTGDLWELLQDKTALAALRRHIHMTAKFFDNKFQIDNLNNWLENKTIQNDVSEMSEEFVEEKESFHDDRLGLLLNEVDGAADAIRERVHHIAWLLHSGYDTQAGAQEMAKVWETLDELMQSASDMEAFIAQVEPGHPLTPQLDERLSQLVQEIAAFPDLSGIRRNDVRLSPLLSELLTDDESLQDVIDALLVRRREPVDYEEIKQRLEKLHKRLTELSQQTVEDELQSAFEVLSHSWREPDRKMEVLGWRYGFDGNGGHTLEECGAHFKVSRERIRQICKPREEALKNCSMWTPALDRALQWLEEQTPLPLNEVGPKLKEEGIARSELGLLTLRHIAQLLQCDVLFETDVVGETSFVQSLHTHEGDDLAAQILSRARRQISRWGVATIEDIAATVNEKRAENAKPDVEGEDEATLNTTNQPTPDADVNAALVERVLSTQSDFIVLDAAAGWFWLSSVTRNGLVGQIKKVLAVAPRVRIADLRVGVSRHHRRQGFAPPQRVLLELCRQLPDLIVEGDEVFVRNGKLDGALSPIELIIANILRTHGPVMTRAELESHCSAAGMARGTFYTYLMHSPIIEKYARGVYGLRGAHVEPGAIESFEPERSRRQTRVLKNYGWATDGKVWVSYALSEGMLSNGVCSVPGAMRRHIEGEYALWTADGSYVGKWTCGNSQAWGIGPFLRRRGGEPGDVLLLVIDITARKVIAELGDESLLEEYQEAGNE